MLKIFKKNLRKVKNFQRASRLGDELLVCHCGKKMTASGVASHSTVCSWAFRSRLKYFFKKYKFNMNCPVCKKRIKLDNKLINWRKSYKPFFCCEECYNKARKLVYFYKHHKKKCIYCKKIFVGYNNTCSKECYSKNLSKTVAKAWKKQKRLKPDVYKARCKNIAKRSYATARAWNKGLHGEEYLKHFVKNGKNNLYEGLKKNRGWFKITTPEIKIRKILKKLKLRFKHGFFICQKQFDFLISFTKNVIILEVDGDYWHKSKLRCKDIKTRSEKRKDDKIKERIIKRIKNTKKEWIIIRFWENDIIYNTKKVYNLIEELKSRSNNARQFKSVIRKIKKCYKEKC